MQDFPNIPGGPKRASASESGFSQQYSFKPSPKTRNPISKKVYKGEVVHGTILDKPEANQAVVRLPTGTFRAYLQGELSKGDSLFFKIVDVSPSLVLRIYAAALSSEGKKIDSSEILRVLNLPHREFYLQLIDYLRSFQSTISREELLLLFNNYSVLLESDLKKASVNDIFRILVYFQELELPFSRNAFSKLLPAFLGHKFLKSNLELIESNLDVIPEEFRNSLKTIFKSIKSANSDFNTMLRLFLSGLKSEFYEVLSQFATKYRQSQNAQILKAVAAANNILDSIEANAIYNSIAKLNNIPMFYYLPFYIAGSLHFVKLKIANKDTANRKRKKSTKFSLKIETGNFGDALAEGILSENNLTLNLLVESDEALSALALKKEELEASLREIGLQFAAINITSKEHRADDLLSEVIKTKQQNFNVVV